MTVHWQRMPRWLAFVCAAVLSLGALFGSGVQAEKGQGNGGNRAVGPTVTAVSPNTGPAAGGTVVTITGTNFSPVAGATSVKFGANAAAGVSCASATQCTATSPAGMNRTDVTVTVNGLTSQTNSKDRFTYVPRLTAITPNHGPAAGNTPVTITGEGLAPGATSLTFGGIATTALVTCAPDGNSCTTNTPAGPAGTANVVATVAGQASNAIPFTYDAAAAGSSLVSVTPETLTYPDTATGSTSAAQVVTVANNGAAAASLTSIVASGDFKIVTPSSCPTGASTLAPNASCTVSVAFAPTAAGTRTGNLTVTESITTTTPATTKTYTVSLGGVGTAGAVELSPASLDFGAVQTGTTSPAQQATLHNAGAAALSVSSIAIAPTTAGFARATPAATNECAATPFSLAAGASCVISLAFKPTATGAQTADLQVVAGTTASTVALKGTGATTTAPTMTAVTPTSGFATGGEKVTVSGTGLTANATTIKFGDIAVSGKDVTCATTTSCDVITPAAPIGPATVTALVNNQASTSPAEVKFTFTARANDGSVTAGPIDPATGYPLWYKDSTGRRLALCITTSARCLAAPPDPTQPLSVPATGSGNFPDEAFYWNVGADAPVAQGKALLTLATETAFAAPGDINRANQTVFNRARVSLTGMTPNTRYTVIHPYAVLEMTTDATGKAVSTVDAGCPAAPCSAQSMQTLGGQIGPWLTWDTGAPEGFIGDPTVAHKITGSPIGQNVFRIMGPNVGGPGVNSVQTDTFEVQGMVPVPTASPIGGIFTAAQSVTLTATDPTTAKIFYTIDGTTPTTASTLYSGPISISATTTLKFIEVYTDGSKSPVVTEVYTIDAPAAGAPTITSITPTSGPAFGGTTVTITGTNFSTTRGATTIKFGADVVAVDNVTCASTTSCTAISPGGAVTSAANPPVHVTAAVAGVTSATSAADQFTYLASNDLGGVSPGAVDPSHGYPSSYLDKRNLRLELCLDQTSGFCLAVPPDTSKPIEFPFNFPDESFWWTGEASFDSVGKGGRGLLVLATEAAFANELPRVGDNVAFNRVRIRLSGLEANADYTVTYPYGVKKFKADGSGVINDTDDQGCFDTPCAFNTPLPGPVGPWLRWSSGAPEGFIGDGVTEHEVTGSPIGQNVFRVEGPNVDGRGGTLLETRLFTVQGKIASPKLSIDNPGGHYAAPVTVNLTATDPDDASDITIFYSLNGTEPTTSSPNRLAAPATLTISGPNTTLKYRAKNNKTGGVTQVFTHNYVIGAVPSASPKGGFYNQPQVVTLTPSENLTPPLEIRYTLDGSEPTASSTLYSGPITISATTTLKFLEVYPEKTTSPVVTEVYTIDGDRPSVSVDPVPGFYHTVQQVGFETTEPATVYYTTDGTDPTTASTQYTVGQKITVDKDTTFKLLAVDLGGNRSDILTAAYHINIGQTAVGPIDPATGFPSWYRDSNGLELKICVDSSGACLTSLPDPNLPAAVPGNFPDESFWWNAGADLTVGSNQTGKAKLVLATEAAFAAGVEQGQQIAFNRIKLVIDGLEPGATYVITHPYGQQTEVADGSGSIRYVEDIGCLTPGTSCLSTQVLGGRLGPWLTWDQGAPTGYVGNPGTPHLVTGSPLGTNFFRIEGKNAGGPGIDRAETPLFTVSGKLSTTP